MWKFCGISQFPWRKRCFSAKPLALFPWEMAVCFPPAPRHAWRDHGQLCSLFWLGGFEEGHFPLLLQDPVGPQFSQSASRAESPRISDMVWWTQMAAQLRAGSEKWCFWIIWLVLSNHSELGDLKKGILAAPGPFSVGGSWKNTKDPLVPLLGAQSPVWVPAVSSSYHGVGETGSAAPFLLWIGLAWCCVW